MTRYCIHCDLPEADHHTFELKTYLQTPQQQEKHQLSKIWTRPYYGVTHCGKVGDIRRASVEDCGEFAFLKQWWKGCGFYPNTIRFPTVVAAQSEGERWIDTGYKI